MAKVYVGTYGKYNNGSIKGGWLDLADYATYDDFLKACAKLHKDERDPEFMIQDVEEFPDGLGCLEWLSREDFNDVKKAMQEEEEDNKPSLSIVDYSDKAFAVVGDTKEVKETLKKLGGRFNGKLSCGAGWIFSNKMREAVEKFINDGEFTQVKREKNNERNIYADALNEYLNGGGDDYYKRESVGAVKLRDHFYLIDKPSIDNKFCFHDEGPDYERYKEVTSTEKSLAEYFKSANLAYFDNKIERITKGDYGDTSVWISFPYNGKEKRCAVAFYNRDNEANCSECTDEEKKAILDGLKYGRKMFEKRLDSYLKKYGVSKIHTWTYWADA